ncbi:MAG: aspartate-semialdehyde dehydrogenase [Ignavibacteria bacterium]|nr:aspartate-semialdehyde dehydrogenase [Ignavibacteria bacterium]MBT8383723.1 aspartate-semialdehyde dehydrogenase [Ignavibacteria bacterium]MBT8390694.1 aspartate-semialdehyde dehydrogenase [Ignavibacteria bacterium]NNJ53318.1 aspartate-semialdehyde dehydrogenase [Ignavibacteriaceae bacterium]NNL22256.1 aspartate-semialdehyde dehydrogenase [Ignavibacteriaceae bacterium]
MKSLKEKIAVAVLGATGSVGQKFIEMLADHPWFEIRELCASDKSAGKEYQDAVDWFLSSTLPSSVKKIVVKRCEPNLKSKVVFSGLDSSVAGKIETEFAKEGYTVISNSKNHRMDNDVPLLIPEVNPDHLTLIKKQNYGSGCIVTNPNCSVIGLVIALKPLADKFGLEAANVSTMQAISGAGHPRVANLDIEDNVIPLIKGEEDKVETEPLKILGTIKNEILEFENFKISAQCNRVNVSDGHTECVQIKLKRKATKQDLIEAWQNFSSLPQELNLPSAPYKPIHYLNEEKLPQPKYQRSADKGMAVSVGRLREDPLFDFKFVVLSHNTVRGAAGGAILCAELMKAQGII